MFAASAPNLVFLPEARELVMMFSSRPPYNDDPMPFLCEGVDGGRIAAWEADLLSDPRYGDPILPSRHEPRPEFDRPQTNPTNPVLAKFREIPEASRESWRTGFISAAEHVRFAAWTDAEADHASRVLTRLAGVAS